MNNFERITASPEALGDFLAPSPSCKAHGTTLSTGRSVTPATRRTATLKTATIRQSGITRPGGWARR